MDPTRAGVDGADPATSTLDPESTEWLAALTATGAALDAAHARLHAMLLRVARSEVRRRAGRLRLEGPELDVIAHDAAADAFLAIAAKLGRFRGESRFTTWAYKFVVLEVSSKVGRHFWRHPGVRMDDPDWDRLPERFGFGPAQVLERLDLLTELRRAVEEDLTPRQRRTFVALVLDAVPVDALAIELGSSRNAVYKTMFDARRKLREVLDANGYLESDTSGPS